MTDYSKDVNKKILKEKIYIIVETSKSKKKNCP